MKGMDPVPTVDGLKEEMADGYSRAVASRSRRAVLTCIISGCAGAEPPKHSRAASVGDRGTQALASEAKGSFEEGLG